MTDTLTQLDADTVNEVVDGYLEAAIFGDAPEGSTARFTKAARAQAEADCRKFIEACGPLFWQAIDATGYSPTRFGHDFWFNRKGHGVGFWDRSELEFEHGQESFEAKDRNGVQFPVQSKDLGRALSEVAYGNHYFISQFAYRPDVEASNGWLHFI